MPTRRDALRLIGRNAAAIAAASALPAVARADKDEPDIFKGSAVAIHGPAKYKEGFANFDYVNPAAPKGGTIYLGIPTLTFDSLNPFILKGSPEAYGSGFTFETLMVNGADEPFTMYGLIAKTIEFPKDRSWVAFEINERARFHDGSPITADDVVFSFDTLVSEKAHPRYRQYYNDVVKAEKTGPLAVKFTFRAPGNRELPLIMGQLSVISKTYYTTRAFDQTTLEPPLASGPYKYGPVSPGKYAVLERVKNYWGADLPVQRGFANFEQIRIDYFRDATIVREAFKSGEFDIRQENQALAWTTQYETDDVRKGLMVKREIPHSRPAGMQCFAMNTRRPQFRDWRVRRALAVLFDFEWSNKNLFASKYTRTTSYFANSEMAATGLPQGEELKILERYKGRIPDSVFKEPYTLPVYAGDGNIRDGIRQALQLFKEAGWEIKGSDLVETKSGTPFKFQVLTESAAMERIYGPYITNLRRIGIQADQRLVDPVQYQKRLDSFDFDMTTVVFAQSESPGNEQRRFWSSAAAETNGSDNYIGIKDKVIDELVDLIINPPDREGLVVRCRALDRVLLHNHYVVPSWHLRFDWLVYWDKFGVPPPHSRGTSFLAAAQTWWYDAAKAERLKGRIRSQP